MIAYHISRDVTCQAKNKKTLCTDISCLYLSILSYNNLNMERDDLKTFGAKIRLLRNIFNVSQKKLGDVLGLEHYYITKWERGIYKPKKDISDLIARYFFVWHRWLYEDNDDFPIFLGTILFRSIPKEDNLRRLVELIHLDGGRIGCILSSKATIVLFFQRSGVHPTSYFVPVGITFEALREMLMPFMADSISDLEKIKKELDEQAMEELLEFASRKRIAHISGFHVTSDRGIILKPHGASSRIISEDKVRALYDSFVRIDPSFDEINEVIRRYHTTFKDK